MAEETAKKTAKTEKPWLFKKGTSGNPRGRRPGERPKVSAILDVLAEGEGREIIRQVIDAAKAGDHDCQKLVLARIWLPRRGTPVKVDLPAVSTPEDCILALSRIIAATASGEITPEEATSLGGLLDHWRSAYQAIDLLSRIEALEALQGTGDEDQ